MYLRYVLIMCSYHVVSDHQKIKTCMKTIRKQLNVFERKVYRRILGPVYDNESPVATQSKA